MSTHRKVTSKECAEEYAVRNSGDPRAKLSWAADAAHGMLRAGLLLVPVFAWNAFFVGLIDKVFPPQKRNGRNIWVRLAYALLITVFILLLLLYTPI